ncbi:putative mitochondrial protein, partial [Mucuna pruriens]
MVLDEYSSVFQAPDDLPPHRRQDHAIILKLESQIPNIRPRKYPHYQKIEIEKLVTKMGTVQHELRLNQKKCTFGQPSLEYLGHVISVEGVAANPKKLEAMWMWPTPKDIKRLRGLLVLMGYYRRFVKGYGKLAKPLNFLLKKDAFQWGDEAQRVFEQLKVVVTTLPILAVLDFTKQFVVETDASRTGLGAILLQEERPLAFWGQRLSATAQQKSVYERELMAVVQSEEWHDWEEEVQKDPHLYKIFQEILFGTTVHTHFKIKGHLYYKSRLVLPRNSARIPTLLKEFHDSCWGPFGSSGCSFMSNFWKELFKMTGTQLRMSTAYHPQMDGQMEVVNRCLDVYLRSLIGTKPRQWPIHLLWAEFWFNMNYNATKMSHFRALYDQDPPTLLIGTAIPSRVKEINQLIHQRDTLLKDLRENLLKAQDQMKKYADHHRRDVQLEVGNWVYLKLQPYRMRSLAKKLNEKLSPRFYGPYNILAKVGAVEYKLELPTHSKIPVFHVALLKKAIHPTQTTQPLTEDHELQLFPEVVLDCRVNVQANRRFWSNGSSYQNLKAGRKFLILLHLSSIPP